MQAQITTVDGDEVTVYFPETEDDLAGFRALVAAHRGSPGRPLGFDVETTGLRIYSPGYRVRTAQFAGPDEAWVLDVEQFAAAISAVLNDRELWFVAHNAQFDVLSSVVTGLADDLESLASRTFDTQVLAKLIDSKGIQESGTTHALKPWAGRYVDRDAADGQSALHRVFKTELGCYDRKNPTAEQETMMRGDGWWRIAVDHPVFVLYAGLDPVYTVRLLSALGPEIRALGLSTVARDEHATQVRGMKMRHRGLRLDVPYTRRLADALDREHARHMAVCAEYGVTKLLSAKEIGGALEGMGVALEEKRKDGHWSVSGEVLAPLADMHAKSHERLGLREPNELAQAVMLGRRAKAWKANYPETMLAEMDADDRIHPIINTIHARTGRMSIRVPAMQTLPSDSWLIRRCIVPDEGQVMFGIDYSSIEFRVLAALAEIEKMKSFIRDGVDLHEVTAALAYGDENAKRMRKPAKIIGLGRVYGGGARTLAKQTGAPVEDVQKVIDAFETLYPEVQAYKKRLGRIWRMNHGVVLTMTGRRLRLDEGKEFIGGRRSGGDMGAIVNYPVQGTARDLLTIALAEIDAAGLLHHVLLPVHDEFLCQAPAAEAEEVMARISAIMTTTLMGVPIDVDAEMYGPNWGAGKDYGWTPQAEDDYMREH